MSGGHWLGGRGSGFRISGYHLLAKLDLRYRLARPASHEHLSARVEAVLQTRHTSTRTPRRTRRHGTATAEAGKLGGQTSETARDKVRELTADTVLIPPADQTMDTGGDTCAG